jgi:hypothetical protein
MYFIVSKFYTRAVFKLHQTARLTLLIVIIVPSTAVIDSGVVVYIHVVEHARVHSVCDHHRRAIHHHSSFKKKRVEKQLTFNQNNLNNKNRI